MCLTLLEKKAMYIDDINQLCLMDDDFMRIVMKDQDCLEFILEIIFHQKISIVEFHTQYDLKNLYGRSLTVDVLAKTSDERYINVEVQKKKTGTNPKRARYHGSC